MKITEIRVKLIDDKSDSRLRSFCSITMDDSFVVRDLKVIDGTKGLFVAMPSRKLTDRCPDCGYKNHLRAYYCNNCGEHLKDDRASIDDDGRAKLHADIAHPINSTCRDSIQRAVIEAYHEERELSKQPGYVCGYDDPDDQVAHDNPKRDSR
jgi:stage V sporulation protein G